MDDNQPTLWEKLAREVSGNASEEDLALLQQKEPELNEVKAQAEQVWKSTSLPLDTYEPNVEHGWQRFQLRVQARKTLEPPKKKKSNFYQMWAAAASISLLLIAGAYFLMRSNHPTWTVVKTGVNETKTVRLADGSTVALNQKSVLSYPVNFQKENRTVRLTGEAFFDVARAEGKRFTIYAQGTKTEVIGTSFNLRAYEREPVKVQVVTGKVAFARTATDDAIFLVPGQEGIIGGKNSTAKKKSIQNKNFQSWKTKNLLFNNTQLDELAAELENHFNVKITVENPALRNCRFTTSFRNPELKEVLEVLAITGNLTITQKGSEYIINGPGCK